MLKAQKPSGAGNLGGVSAAAPILIGMTAILLGCFAVAGCSSQYASVSTAVQPSQAQVVFNAAQTPVTLKVEVANTQAERTQGLMGRSSLDKDSGMIFVWDQPVKANFTMRNTYIPLSIAFISENGEILEIQDMQPQSPNLYKPAGPYRYAIEVNQGFFAENGIKAGDRTEISLP